MTMPKLDFLCKYFDCSEVLGTLINDHQEGKMLLDVARVGVGLLSGLMREPGLPG